MAVCANGHGPRFKDLAGKKVGMLTVVQVSHRRKTNSGCTRIYWACKCECGKELSVMGCNLHSGHTTSCGCRRLSEIPNSSRSKDYYVWNAMIHRCHNPRSKAYRYYGGRGIKVCDRWRNSLAAFLQDMGQPPSPKHSIDRINCDGDYEPENCRWAPPEVQANNRRNNRKYTHEGVTLSIAQWSRVTGISYGTLWRRLEIDKMPFIQAIVPPKTTSRRRQNLAP